MVSKYNVLTLELMHGMVCTLWELTNHGSAAHMTHYAYPDLHKHPSKVLILPREAI